jgi:muramoyltetrapeptide carboxypeptidase
MSIKPHRIRIGDNIGIVAPSGPCYKDEKIVKGIEGIKALGFNVVVGDTVYKRDGYLAGSDYERAMDINDFFGRSDIDGIICLRGGYGAQRIIDKIDYKIIADNPKVFIGYSDITALHAAINKICGMVTFHGPVVTEIGDLIDEYTKNSLLQAVMSAEPLMELKNPEDAGCINILSGGEASGYMAGGNLSLIASSIGTPYEIDTYEKILFIEDIGEEPYRVDRMLTQLILSGKLQECNGIVLGQWPGCQPEKPYESLSLMEVLADRFVPLGIPVLYNLACGHEKTKMTIPLGVKARITADGKLIIEEGGVI